MTTRETFFELPTDPDEFGVALPLPSLRRLDFSALDYENSRRVIIEYIKTYYPAEFNDFVDSNGFLILMDIVAALCAKLSLRGDMFSKELLFPTSESEEVVAGHLALIGQRIRRQTAATTNIEAVVDKSVDTEIRIPAGTSFQFTGPDGASVTYEIYRFPGNWSDDIVIPAGARGVVAYGIEGAFATPLVVSSEGGANQQYTIEDADILESPLLVFVTDGEVITEWTVVTEPIQRYGPSDKVVEVSYVGNKVIFEFGDDVTGATPAAGASIEFRYRIGGGLRGRIGVGQIDATRQLSPAPPVTVGVPVRFRNITASDGGADKETIPEAKRRAPRDFATQKSFITAEDYAQASGSYSHPVYGTVSKAVSTVRTSVNTNLVEIYALAEGSDGRPTSPSVGLRTGLETYLRLFGGTTDQIVVLDGAMHTVDIDMVVAVHRNVDTSVVRGQVEAVVTDFFRLTNWDMGQPFYVSNFIEAIEAVDGVSFVNLRSPNSNILPTGKIAGAADGVGFNEVIVEGTRKISYFYEKAPPPAGIRAGL